MLGNLAGEGEVAFKSIKQLSRFAPTNEEEYTKGLHQVDDQSYSCVHEFPGKKILISFLMIRRGVIWWHNLFVNSTQEMDEFRIENKLLATIKFEHCIQFRSVGLKMLI